MTRCDGCNCPLDVNSHLAVGGKGEETLRFCSPGCYGDYEEGKRSVREKLDEFQPPWLRLTR